VRTPRPTIALVSACVLLAGCSATVDGVATKAPRPTPRALAQILPTQDELSATLGSGPDGFMGQLVQGGADTLLHGVDESEASPADCVSATFRLQRIVYASSPVRSVASRSWTGGDFDAPALSGFFGVVTFATADDAQAFFAKSVDKWQRCNDRTMKLHQPQLGIDGSSTITDVVADGRVVSAVVTHDDVVTIQRALGVASDCIVDVEIADLGGHAGDRDAADVANLMLDKVVRAS
jgi:hypothetical protein